MIKKFLHPRIMVISPSLDVQNYGDFENFVNNEKKLVKLLIDKIE